MEDVLETFQLGPNGGLIYSVEYLEKNIQWLKGKIKEQQKLNPSQCTQTKRQQAMMPHAARLCRSLSLMLLCCFAPADAYFLFDLPGQVELYTHHQSLRHIVDKMTQSWDLKVRHPHSTTRERPVWLQRQYAGS